MHGAQDGNMEEWKGKWSLTELLIFLEVKHFFMVIEKKQKVQNRSLEDLRGMLSEIQHHWKI